jgi:hypothetical protein
MGPSNDRERAIAKVVDQIAIEGRLKLISIQEATNVVGFKLTDSENTFLLRYIQWRMANPILK